MSHLSVVHLLPSLQVVALFTQFPVAISQESAVHALLSLQSFFTNVGFPLRGLQLAIVHASGALNMIAVLIHTPATHLSAVQGLLSLQSTPVETHPLTGSHLDLKHLSWLSQVIGS
jgi:hypothetical protein